MTIIKRVQQKKAKKQIFLARARQNPYVKNVNWSIYIQITIHGG